MSRIVNIKFYSGDHEKFHGYAEAYTLLEENPIEKDLIIFLTHVWENNIFQELEELKKFVNVLKTNRPSCKIFLIANSSDDVYNDKICQVGFDDILYIDFFLYRVYKEIIKYHKSSVVNRMTQNTPKNKFLFLTGKLRKINRIGLFRKFVDTNLINQAEWSLHYFPEHQSELTKLKTEYFSDMTQLEFDDFLKLWKRNPDNIDVYLNRDNLEYNGIPYDVKLYSSTDFSIISETYFGQNKNSSPWITEKTWIPILNKHPFLIAGDVGILKILEDLGFSVFREFLKIKDYDSIIDENERIDAIVENTKHLLETLDLHNMSLHADHNFRRMTELYKINYDKILNFIHNHNLEDKITAEELVQTHGRNEMNTTKKIANSRFREFYNDIKGQDWPDCNTEQEFYNLPKYIQDECVNQFGYVPASKEDNANS